MPRPPPTHDDEHWLARLDAHVALKLLGRRSFDIALASGMLYGEAPTLGQAGFVHAVLVEPGRGVGGAVDIQSRVAVRLRDDDSLAVECSRCMASFGPCRHGAALTVDLAIASALRDAVLAGESRFDPNEAVRAARRDAPRGELRGDPARVDLACRGRRARRDRRRACAARSPPWLR
ncbi:MAG: hypothetical protein U0235_09090 [Polyangiaceae bacterium]